MFTDAMLTYCENTIRGACNDLTAHSVKFNGEADHVHLLVSYPPTLPISQLIQRLNGRTAHDVRREYTRTCVRARLRAHIRSPSHFTVSYGSAPQSIINHYLDSQTRPH